MEDSNIVIKNQKKLFKYYIDRNTAQEASKKNFWYRTNRWRYNTLDKSSGEISSLISSKFINC